MKNTRIRYCYVDGHGRTFARTVVVRGGITAEQKFAVLTSLADDGFIPYEVGLPQSVPAPLEGAANLHPLFKLWQEDIILTDAPATLDISIDEVTEKFVANKGLWAEKAAKYMAGGFPADMMLRTEPDEGLLDAVVMQLPFDSGLLPKDLKRLMDVFHVSPDTEIDPVYFESEAGCYVFGFVRHKVADEVLDLDTSKHTDFAKGLLAVVEDMNKERPDQTYDFGGVRTKLIY